MPQYETLVQRYTSQLEAILGTYQLTIDPLNGLELQKANWLKEVIKQKPDGFHGSHF